MTTLAALRDERRVLAREMRNLLDRHPGQSWGSPQQQTFDQQTRRLDDLDARISEREAVDERIRARSLEVRESETSPIAVTRAWLRRGDAGLSDEQARTVRNTMGTGTGSQGGFTVPAGVSQRFVDTLKDFSGVRRLAEVIATDAGANLPWPTSDGTAEVGELIAENASATSADPSFGSVGMPTYKYSSKVVTVPIELLMDSAIDIVQLVFDRLAARIGRITNTHFTIGSGSGQPQGFSGAATVGKIGGTGQTTTVIHDDLVDLIHSVNAAYRQDPRGTVGFAMSDAAFKVARKLKDSSQRPLYLPSDGASPESILGYPVSINDDIAAPAANVRSIFFGNWRAAYKVRDVRQVIVVRMEDSAYTVKGQVAFLALTRAGGNLVDTAAVKAYQHSAT